MKYLCFGLAILVLLIAGSWLSADRVTQYAEELIAPLERASAAVGRGDLRAAEQHLHSAEQRWERRESFFSALLSHSYTTKIDDAVDELLLLDGDAFTLRCEGLIRLLRQLQEMDLPKLKNIF